MLHALILFAGEEAKKETDVQPSPWGFLFPLVAMFVIFYFLIIVPGRKDRQQRQAMITALKKHDKVITSGGIIGVVTNIREGTEEVTIKSDESKFIILKSSIARILTEPEASGTAPGPSTQIKPAP